MPQVPFKKTQHFLSTNDKTSLYLSLLFLPAFTCYYLDFLAKISNKSLCHSPWFLKLPLSGLQEAKKVHLSRLLGVSSFSLFFLLPHVTFQKPLNCLKANGFHRAKTCVPNVRQGRRRKDHYQGAEPVIKEPRDNDT